MTAPHKSSTKACNILFNNGNETALWVGHNHNTGATIVWQRTFFKNGTKGRYTRITGGNIIKLAGEIRDTIQGGEAVFVYRNAAMSVIA